MPRKMSKAMPKKAPVKKPRMRQIVEEIDNAKYKGRRSSAKHGGKGGENMK